MLPGSECEFPSHTTFLPRKVTRKAYTILGAAATPRTASASLTTVAAQ